MAVRSRLIDEAWAAIESIPISIKHKGGECPELSDRTFLGMMLCVARPGIFGREIPTGCGRQGAVCNRLHCWESCRLWQQLWERIQTEE
jgi:hypothetical protein